MVGLVAYPRGVSYQRNRGLHRPDQQLLRVPAELLLVQVPQLSGKFTPERPSLSQRHTVYALVLLTTWFCVARERLV